MTTHTTYVCDKCGTESETQMDTVTVSDPMTPYHLCKKDSASFEELFLQWMGTK